MLFEEQQKHSRDKRALFDLLHNKDFISAQLLQWGDYKKIYESFEHAISMYLEADTPEDTQRLCQLVIQAGKISHEAQSNAACAFQLVQNGEIDKALDILQVLNEVEFYKSVLLLLWTESERQKAMADDQKTTIYAKLILDKLLEKIPITEQNSHVQIVNWQHFLDPSFMVWWSQKVRNILTCEQILEVLSYSNFVLCDDFIQAGKQQLSRTAMEEALKLALSEKSPSHRHQKLSKIAKLLGENNDHQQAYMVFLKIFDVQDEKVDFYKNNTALSKISQTLLEQGEYSQALEIAQRIVSIDERNSVLFQMVRKHIQNGDFAVANEILEKIEIPDHFIIRIYNLLETANLAFQTKNHLKMIEVLMQALFFTRDIESSASTRHARTGFLEIIAAKLPLRKMEEALNSLEERRERYLILSKIGEAAVFEDQIPQALLLISRLNDDEKATALTEFSHTLMQQSAKKSACWTMLQDLLGYNFDENNAVVEQKKQTVLQKLGNEGMISSLQQLLSVADTIEDLCKKHCTKLTVAKYFVALQCQEHQKIYTEARNAVASIEKPQEKSEVLVKIFALAVASESPDIQSLLQQNLDVTEDIEDSYQQDMLRTSLIEILLGAKNNHLCHQIFTIMPILKYRDEAYRKILQHLESSENKQLILTTSNFAQEHKASREILLKIAQILNKVKDKENFDEIILKALQDQESFLSPKLQVISLLAELQHFSQALELAEPLEGFDRTIALRDISIPMGKNGRFSDALALAKTIEDQDDNLTSIRQQALVSITEELAQTQDFAQALDTLEEITNLSDKTRIIQHAAKQSLSSNDFDFVDWLENAILPMECKKDSIQNYQEEVLKTNSIIELQKTLSIFPFDLLLAWRGVTNLLLLHLKQQNHEYVDHIREIYEIWK